jgi:cold shock protein
VAFGRILRFDEVRGYGFIASAEGGEDVFVHANDFGAQRHLVHPGMQVEYEVEAGERGLKVASIRILEDAPAPPAVRALRTAEIRSVEGRPMAAPAGEDDGMCDVLVPREFTTEVTEVLLQHVPSLTGGQIAQIRQHLVDLARSHGWVES